MKACNQLCPWNTLYGCKKPESEPCILSNVACEKFEPKSQTNADHYRSLSDEDLAKCLAVFVQEREDDATYTQTWLEWLKQPYEKNT